MWYKYLNRTCDQLRLFRKTNLKFNQDDLGMTRVKVLSKTNDLLFRLARSEGTLRGFTLFFLMGFISSALYLKSTFYDPVYTAPKLIETKRKEEEIDRKARQTLLFNNLGAPTKPTRKMEDFLLFISSSQALNKNFDFISYGLELNSDQIAGLDAYSGQTDERMLELLRESKERSGGH